MTWEKYKGGGQGRNAAGPKISLRKSGSIGINNAAIEEHFEDTEAVVIMYNEEENRVGFKRLEDKEEDKSSYTLSKSESGGAVTPQAFLRENDLIPNVTTQYRPQTEEVDGEELVYIDADESIGTYGKPADEESSD